MQDQTQPLTVSIRADGSIFLQETAGRLRQPRAARCSAMAGAGLRQADLRARRRPGALRGGGPGDGGAVDLRLHHDQPDHRHRRSVVGRRPSRRRAGRAGPPWRSRARRDAAGSSRRPWSASVLLHAAVLPAVLIVLALARDLKVGSVGAGHHRLQRPGHRRPAGRAGARAEQTAAGRRRRSRSAPARRADAAAAAAEPAARAAAAQADAHAAKAGQAGPRRPTPRQAAAPPAKPEKSLDLDALAASISKTSKPRSPSRSAARKRGPARPETAPQARADAGDRRPAAAHRPASHDELQRRWNPNCDVEGGRDVQVRVTFQLGAGGQLVGDVAARRSRRGRRRCSRPPPTGPCARSTRPRPSAACRANSTVRQITVNFNANEACSNR